DVRAAADGGDDAAAFGVLVAALELAADHTGLAPQLARLQLAVGRQAGQLGAGAGAAGRAVVGLAGAQHEVAAVGLGVVGEQLDVVDQAAVLAADALVFQRLLHGHRVGGEGVQIVAGYAQAVVADQEEPVAAPGDIAGYLAVTRHVDGDRL